MKGNVQKSLDTTPFSAINNELCINGYKAFNYDSSSILSIETFTLSRKNESVLVWFGYQTIVKMIPTIILPPSKLEISLLTVVNFPIV